MLWPRAVREDIHRKTSFTFGHFPNYGEGGSTHARIYWSFFYQVIVPKMAICYSNFTVIACFLVNFCHNHHQNYHNYHHNYHCNHHYHHWHFFWSYAQNIVFDVRKKRTKLPELGSGGGITYWFGVHQFWQFWRYCIYCYVSWYCTHYLSWYIAITPCATLICTYFAILDIVVHLKEKELRNFKR